jgi:hypothetical protein
VAAGVEGFDSLLLDDDSLALEVEAAAPELLSPLAESDFALSDDADSAFAGSDSLFAELVPFL